METRLEIDIEAVALVSSVVVESPDSKIKCQANNGGRRRPKVTFIYQITLEAAGKEYIYYAEPGGTLSLCKER